MKKDELLQLLIDAFEDVTNKKEAEVKLKEVDNIIEIVSNALNEDQKVTIGKYLTIENKFIKARSGVSKIGGVEKPWNTPEHYEYKIKNTKVLNK